MKNIIFLILGRATSKFGSMAYLTVLPLYILDRTQSLAFAGFFLMCTSLPAVLCSSFLGVLVDRISRKKLIIFCDLCCAAIYAALLYFKEGQGNYIAWLMMASIMINILSNLFEISSKVLFTELLEKAEIGRYNGLKSLTDNMASIAAPIAGTFLWGWLGFRCILALMGVLYLLSAVQESAIIYKVAFQKPERERGAGQAFLDGLRFISRDKNIRPLFLMVVLLNFFLGGMEEIMNPGMVVQKYGINEALFGIAASVSIAGSICAGMLIFKSSQFSHKDRMTEFIVCNSAVMIGVGGASIVLFPEKQLFFVVFLLCQFLIGLLTTCVNVPLSSKLQVSVPVEYQGRFFAVLAFFSGLLVPAGSWYSGLLASYVGADWACMINNLFVIAVALAIRRRL